MKTFYYLFFILLLNLIVSIPITTELTSSSFSETDSELTSWNCVHTNIPLVTDCGSYHLLGGFDILQKENYCQKTYNALIPFYNLIIGLTFLKIDSWPSKDFQFLIDNVIKFSQTFSISDDTLVNYCGNNIKNDARRTFSFVVAYSTTPFTIKLQTTLSIGNTGSWGFRDLIIMSQDCDYSCESCSGGLSTQCLFCYNHATLNLNNECICDIHYYMITEASCTIKPCSQCLICDSICESCLNSASFCLSCYSNTFLYNNDCLPNCPDGFYKNIVTNSCDIKVPCTDSNCADCQSNSNICVSCTTNYFLLNQVCISNCGHGYYQDINLNMCVRCVDLNCNSCLNSASICSSCINNFFLKGSICVDDCGLGYFKNVASYTCVSCLNANCLNCFEGSSKCTLCKPTYFLKGYDCVMNCGDSFYPDLSNKICISCTEINCLSCKDSKDICTQCKGDFYINKNKNECVRKCPLNTITDEKSKSCLNCDPSCKICINPSDNGCLECSNTDLFVDNGVCVKDCGLRKYKINGKCLDCVNNCLNCDNNYSCNYCLTNYSYNKESNLCNKKKELTLKISDIKNPFVFKFIFSEGYDLLIDDLKISTLFINNFDKNFYTYTFEKTDQNNIFLLTLDYQQNIAKETQMKTTILISNNEYILTPIDYYVKLFIPINCTQNTNSENSNCVQLKEFSIALLYSTSEQYKVIIQNVFPSFQSILKKIFSLSMDKIDTNSYNYTLSNFQNISSLEFWFTIDFNFFISIPNSPILTIYIILNTETILLNNLIIIKNSDTIKMLSFYLLSNSTKELIKATTAASDTADIFSFLNMIINVIVNAESSLIIRGLMLINVIQMIKYVQINYPPNAIELFKSKKDSTSFLKLFSIEINSKDMNLIPQLFSYYDVSPYFWNNVSADVNIIIISILIGFLTIYIFNSKKKRKISNEIFNTKIIHSFEGRSFYKIFKKKIKSIIVWSLSFNIFFSKLQSVTFFSMVTLCFTISDSFETKLNFCLAILAFIMILLFPFHIYKILANLKFINLSTPFSKTLKIQNKQERLDILDEIPTGILPDRNNNKKEINKQETSLIEELPRLEKLQPIMFRNSMFLSHNKSARKSKIFPVDFFDKNNNALTPESLEISNKNLTNPDNIDDFLNSKDKFVVNSNDLGTKKNSIALRPFVDEKFHNQMYLSNKFKNLNITAQISHEKDKNNIEQKINKSHNGYSFFKLIFWICTMFFFYINKIISNIYKTNTFTTANKFNKRFKFLWNDFKTLNFIQRNEILFDIMRHMLLSMIVVLLFKYPIYQIVLMEICNLILLIIIIIFKPYKHVYMQILTIISEILINLAFFSAISIAIFDYLYIEDINNRMKLGWVILFCNIILLYILVLITIIRLFTIVFNLFKSLISKCLPKNK